MKTFRALAIYAMAVVALGLVMSLPVQAVCLHLGWFADKPWLKFFSRCATVAALVCLWPLLRALGMASWQGIGLQSPPALALARGAAGWVAAFAGTMLLGWTAVLAGNRVWDTSPSHDFIKPLAVGCVVGIIEEVFFRGLLFGAFGVVRSLGKRILAAHQRNASAGVNARMFGCVARQIAAV
ncbi:MAG: hypothetical protein N2689_09245, partial [Verrucomicrobiae bacterium]|nr:hypothetical protein [Verrucomicrobiae bacterium]